MIAWIAGLHFIVTSLLFHRMVFTPALFDTAFCILCFGLFSCSILFPNSKYCGPRAVFSWPTPITADNSLLIHSFTNND